MGSNLPNTKDVDQKNEYAKNLNVLEYGLTWARIGWFIKLTAVYIGTCDVYMY